MKGSILKFSTIDFDCIVRANRGKVADRQNLLLSVLQKRASDKASVSMPNSVIRLNDSLVILPEYKLISNERVFRPESTSALTIPNKPLFFENTNYEIEVRFFGSVKSCLPSHSLERIKNSFTVSDEDEKEGDQKVWFRISLNFSNDLGWFNLPFSYVKNGVELSQNLSFEVFPFKMDMEQDLNEIYKLLDKSHPLLRFSLNAATEQSFNRSKFTHEPFELLWLAEFKSLNEQLRKGYKRVLNAPHNRLLPRNMHLKAERIKGKFSNKLAEKVTEDIHSGLVTKRYKVERKKLSVDTPENQFIKATLNDITKKLEVLNHKISDYDQHILSKSKSKEPMFSEGFYDQLNSLITPYQKFKRFPLFKEISDFKGLKSESLVLQQKTGYSAVYQAWQKLKYYLDVLGKDASISVKNIAEIYEIWCFLQLADILKNSFGFKDVGIDPMLVELNSDKQTLEYSFKSGKESLFKLSRGHGDNKIEIELKHEFAIGSKNKNASSSKNGYVAWMAEHKPDIFMKVTFANQKEYVWLFDAKYRIDDVKGAKDWVPVDALTQMHRYRDAIIYQHFDSEQPRHSRPIYGAYALYPGYYEIQEKDENPYNEAIDSIDIGAFPFLPGSDNQWLIDFLANRLGLGNASYNEEFAEISFPQIKSAKILQKNNG